MITLIKNNYVNICIALVYSVLACLVYGIWSYSAWHLWYVTLIVVLFILAVSAVISYFWLKSEIMHKKEQSAKNSDVIDVKEVM